MSRQYSRISATLSGFLSALLVSRMPLIDATGLFFSLNFIHSSDTAALLSGSNPFSYAEFKYALSFLAVVLCPLTISGRSTSVICSVVTLLA
ncbi:hypothetical protein D3C72_2118570 [compost metagenome]